MSILLRHQLSRRVMKNHSSDTSAPAQAHLGSHENYFQDFSLTYEPITSSRVLIYTAWHCTPDACSLRKLMLLSGGHAGSWRTARRPAEHDPTFTLTSPTQGNRSQELHRPRSRNQGIPCIHQTPEGPTYADVINERSCADVTPAPQVATRARHFLMSRGAERVAKASSNICVSSFWIALLVVALACDKIQLASSAGKGIYLICSVNCILYFEC